MDAALTGLVSNRFVLGGLLGTGGSASVFEALDTETGRPVALKILHPHLSRSVAAREAFFVEAQAASALKHPNILTVLGFGVHDADADALAWIVLELAPGMPLSEYVEKHGALGVQSALEMADGVLCALEFAHAQGVMHRDVSAANVMVAFDDAGDLHREGVRLVDFGLADAAGRPALGSDILRTAPGSDVPRAVGVLGSVNFMSPEQALGMPVDERGDLYQTGALLYFALTAHPPFARTTLTAVMRAHVSAPPPVPSVLRRAVPRQPDRLVVRSMLKDPTGRYASAAEMGAEVREIAARRLLRTSAATVGAPAGSTLQDASTARMVPDGMYASRLVADPRGGEGASSPVALPAASSGRGVARGGVLAVAVLAVTAIAVAWVLSIGTGSPTPRADASAATAPATSAAADTAVGSPQPGTAGSAPPAGSAIGSTPNPVAEATTVPTVAGLSVTAARATLQTAGLALGIMTVHESPAPGDTVLSSAPAAAVSVASGSAVDLEVASGSNVVPAVRGLPQNEAVAALQAAGFAVLIGQRADPNAMPGTAISTVPTEYAVVPLGTSVTVSVASAPMPSTTPPTQPVTSASPTAPGSTVAPTPIPTRAAG